MHTHILSHSRSHDQSEMHEDSFQYQNMKIRLKIQYVAHHTPHQQHSVKIKQTLISRKHRERIYSKPYSHMYPVFWTILWLSCTFYHILAEKGGQMKFLTSGTELAGAYFWLKVGTYSCHILITTVLEIQIHTASGQFPFSSKLWKFSPSQHSTKPVCPIHSFRLQNYQERKRLRPGIALSLPPKRSSPQVVNARIQIHQHAATLCQRLEEVAKWNT